METEVPEVCGRRPCDASGNIIGVNPVSKVALEILGAGSFEGVLIEPTHLRGTFSAPGGYDTITFHQDCEII